MSTGATIAEMDVGRGAMPALLYFGAYMAYLFAHPENELMHWVTLVSVPFIGLYLLQRRKMSAFPLQRTLATVGLRRENLRSGLHWAVLLGLGLSALQLAVSRRSGEILQIFQSGRFLFLFPITLLIMLLTAGFTEEFFFRGVVQTRLASRLNSNFWAVAATSVLFSVYHLPYAYLNPRWPSHGNLPAAVNSALVVGGFGGVILGTVYARTRNLVACVVVHALINVLPGMPSIARLLQ